MRRILAILAALSLAPAAAACGEREEPVPAGDAAAVQPFDVLLDYFPNPDHAGLYAAQANGDFERAGLDVTLRTPSDPSAPLKLLQAGRVDLAISYEPELLLARDKGAKLVSIGALVQTPLTSLMSVGEDRITQPEELRGKKVGTAGIPYQDAYLDTILEEAGVPPSSVDRVDVGFNLTPAMLSDRVDATLGAFWNVEGVELERRDRDPVILRMDELGVPTYNELIFVVREEDARSRGPELRRFLQAAAQGHRALRRDVAEGLDPLLEANPDLRREPMRASIEATVPVFFPEDRERPFGYQDVDQWRAYARWMLRNGLITQPPEVERALTNEYLPGEGLAEEEGPQP